MTRTRPRAAALTLLTTGLTAGAVAASLVSGPAPVQAVQRTSARSTGDIALTAWGYGTATNGGLLPARSDPTAFEAIGCVVRTGVDRRNHVAEARVPGLGTASGITTHLWTRRRNGALHSYSRNSIAGITVAQSGLGRLRIEDVTSFSHAWHNRTGFHAATATSIGRLVYVSPTGDRQRLDLPSPGRPVVAPNLAVLTFGGSLRKTTDDYATARATSLKVRVLPTATTSSVGRSVARALTGVKNGRFGGFSAGTQVTALGGDLTSGRNPLTRMHCQGTDGKVESKTNAGTSLGGQIVVSAPSSSQWARRFPRRSTEWEKGEVARLNLGGGQLVVDAVVGTATVTRTAAGRLRRSADGTTVGSITANGEPQTFPDTGVLEIPGVARLQQKVVTKVLGGLKVVGLRITLLDGSAAGSVIDLGVAKATIR